MLATLAPGPGDNNEEDLGGTISMVVSQPWFISTLAGIMLVTVIIITVWLWRRHHKQKQSATMTKGIYWHIVITMSYVNLVTCLAFDNFDASLPAIARILALYNLEKNLQQLICFCQPEKSQSLSSHVLYR